MQNQIHQIVSDIPKGGIAIGGIGTPFVANNPGVIDWHWLTVNHFLFFTYDAWIMIVGLAVSAQTLGLFRAIQWVYRKIKARFYARA